MRKAMVGGRLVLSLFAQSVGGFLLIRPNVVGRSDLLLILLFVALPSIKSRRLLEDKGARQY